MDLNSSSAALFLCGHLHTAALQLQLRLQQQQQHCCSRPSVPIAGDLARSMMAAEADGPPLCKFMAF